MEPVVKKPWQSKTIWVNAILALVAFFPEELGVQAYINESNLLLVASVVNIILRAVSKDGIQI